MNIVLIGAQGSGKGTQSRRLAQALGVCYVASGDLFRKEIAEETELGVKAKAFIDRGELVPDDITVPMVLRRVAETDCMGGVLLDGFPRTIAQAKALDEGLHHAGRLVNCAVYLMVPREVLLHRLSGRYICRAQQHVYNVNTRPPKVPGVCDIDGSPLYQRSDDTGEAVQRRLDIFFNETIQLLGYYDRQGKLLKVDGNQNIDQVQTALLAVIKQVSG